MIATIFTPCLCNISLFSIVSSRAIPIAHSSASKTAMRPVPEKLLQDLHRLPCLDSSTAPTRLSSERNPSAHHIHTPAPILASFPLLQRCAVLLAAVASSRMIGLPTDTSPRAGHIMTLVVQRCSCCALTTLHIGAPWEGIWCNSFSMLLNASGCHAANHCCLESMLTGARVNPDSLISGPCTVVRSASTIDLAWRLTRT
jgi:hypothetical protein